MKKLLLLISSVYLYTSCSAQDTISVNNEPKIIESNDIIIDSTKLTKELLVGYITSKQIAHPEIAYAIVRLESNMVSNLFKTNNNLFGMRHPRVRPTKSLGNKRGFAHFEKWQHSVDDYKMYLEFVRGHDMTRENYLNHLDRNYASKGYTRHLVKFMNEYKTILNNL